MNWSAGTACISSCMDTGKCNMSTRKIISCHLHDYIEIACLHGYEIELQLLNGDVVTGQALTTETDSDKKEYLLVKKHDQTRKVLLTNVKKMKALTRNPHFDHIDFQAASLIIETTCSS